MLFLFGALSLGLWLLAELTDNDFLWFATFLSMGFICMAADSLL